VDDGRRAEVNLDAAVAQLRESFRAALDEPERATAADDARTLRARFDEPLPDHGQPAAKILKELEERSRGGLAGGTGSRYFGYVTGGVLPAAAIVEAWTAAVDQNVGMWPLGPAAVELEQVTLRWLADLLEYPHGSGYFASGATMANTIGLGLARHAFGKRHGVDVRQGGVRKLPEFSVYGSEELHLSDYKALRTLGLGADCVRAIPIDANYGMRADVLGDSIAQDRARGVEPAIVIAQAGSVNTGASDPIDEVADLCAKEGIWLHVDGAFGAFFRLCDRTRSLAAGIERADSIAVDAHKWLNVPNGVGFVLTRHMRLHEEAFAGTAAYLTPDEGMNLHELGIEASRSWRGACVWAAVKELGRTGVEALVSRCCELTAQMAEEVERSQWLELTAPAPSCVCCFRFRPPGWEDGAAIDDLNRRIQVEAAREGTVFFTGAMLANRFTLRAAIVNWRTQSTDISALIDTVTRIGTKLTETTEHAGVAEHAL